MATSLQHPKCVRASIRRVAGCATPIGSAGHVIAGTTAKAKLTFHLDHSAGADQPKVAQFGIFTCPLVKVITTLEDGASAIGGTFESVICGAAPGVPPRGTV